MHYLRKFDIFLYNIQYRLVLIVAGVWILVTVTFSHFSVWGLFTPFYLMLIIIIINKIIIKSIWITITRRGA